MDMLTERKQVARMTEQEAINEFKERLAIPDYKESIPKYYEAMEMAVKALEKQIEKKPIKDKEFSSLFDCPSCGRRQKIMYEQNYCKVCGQKLDWGNEDAE